MCDTHDELPDELRQVFNIRADFGRAIGLFSRGDDSTIVVRTIVDGIRAYRRAKWPLPAPIGYREQWNLLVMIVDRSMKE